MVSLFGLSSFSIIGIWPISTEELKRNRNLVQNPGWKYFD
ncbi:RagB/SusD family nutrient uptake outer membrane protein [Bacteroides caecimuris]